MEIPQIVPIQDVVIQSRIRKDLGDIPGLANSIKENGLIEPIVLTHDWRKPESTADSEVNPLVPWADTGLIQPFIKLVAGERRLTALKSLGLQELVHATHYVWRSELESDAPDKKLLFASIEMEENLRRKDLTWTEQILGKQKLLEIMQAIHGLPIIGRPTTSESASSKPGFGVNKLSEMLGESKAQTSEDLELAALITKIPILAGEPNREAAKRKLELAMKIALGQNTPRVAQVLHYSIMISCDDEAHQATLLSQLRGAGLKCTPVVT